MADGTRARASLSNLAKIGATAAGSYACLLDGHQPVLAYLASGLPILLNTITTEVSYGRAATPAAAPTQCCTDVCGFNMRLTWA